MRFLTEALFLVALFVEVVVSISGRSYYDILGVSRSVSPKDLKKAYKELVRKYHPDRNNAPDAQEKFQEVNKAYEVLKDEKNRKLYNRGGEEAVQKQAAEDNQGGGGGFWGSMFNRGGQDDDDEGRIPTGNTIRIPLLVSLEQIYNGDQFKITRVKGEPEETTGTRKCKCKKVRKRVQMAPGFFTEAHQDVCQKCPQIKFVPKPVELDVDVESGMMDGHEIVFYSEGDPHVDGLNGDLILEISTAKHATYTRRANDLYTNMTISLVDALTGFDKELTHMDGHKFTVSRTQPTHHGLVQKIAREGLPVHEVSSRHGDLYITYSIEFPTDRLSGENAETLRGMFPQTEMNVYNGLGQ